MIIYNPTANDIKSAAKILKEVGIVSDNKFPSVFKGYASSFGVSIAQCGLMATLVTFESANTEAVGRQLFPEAIRRFLNVTERVTLSSICVAKAKEIENAAVAFKIALRMFEPVKKMELGQTAKNTLRAIRDYSRTFNPTTIGISEKVKLNNPDYTAWHNISRAIDILKRTDILVGNKYPKVFKSYASAFGASIAQCGLMATVITFENSDSQAEGRPLFTEVIRRFLNIKDGKALSCECNAKAKEIVDASVVFKMALRLFEPDEKMRLGDTAKNILDNIKKFQRETSIKRLPDPTANMGHEFQFNNRDITSWKDLSLPISENEGIITQMKNMKGFTSFTLKVEAPGLLIGSGLSHGVAGSNDDFKNGMQFDYTTGLPIIPGSSVKGVLKSYFKDFAPEFIQKETEKGIDIETLIDIIFTEGNEKDIFADALLTKASPNGRVVGEDYITPHYPNLLSEPNLIKILKVLPGVEFTFCFRLTDSPGLPAKEKMKCFKKILKTVGIGAKTNVGYGRMKTV